MTNIAVVCFKWRSPRGYRSVFGPETVNALRRMVARNYPHPHRFICVTDDANGVDPEVEIVPLWNDFASIPNPHGRHNPSCYRRLRAYASDAEQWFGPRFVMIDLDTVIVGDLTALFHRPEDFVMWGETDPRSFYNGSMVLMTAGARKQVYERFDPRVTPMQAKSAGKFGSDQGAVSYLLGPGEATWGREDGVYSYRVHIHPQGDRLPANAKVIMFHGKEDPWGRRAQQLPWVREHWGVAA